MTVTIPGFTSNPSFSSLFVTSKLPLEAHEFDAPAFDSAEIEDEWFDALENPDELIPVTEDARRCMKKMISEFGELKQNEMVFNTLLKCFPAFPVEIVNAAYSLYTTLIQGKNIDQAVLNTLGLTSSYLLADGNIIARIAHYIRETVSDTVGDYLLNIFLPKNEHGTSGYFFTALAVLAIVAKFYWRNDNHQPQRSVFRAPVFLSHLLLRVSTYWNQLERMARHAALRCEIALPNTPAIHCVLEQNREQVNHRVLQQQSWFCSETSDEQIFSLKPVAKCDFTYTPEELKTLPEQGILFTARPLQAPPTEVESSDSVTVEEDIWEDALSEASAANGDVKIEMSPLLLPLSVTAAALSSQTSGCGTATKVAGAVGATLLASATLATTWLLSRKTTSGETPHFAGELTETERQALEKQQLQAGKIMSPEDNPLSEDVLSAIEEDILTLAQLQEPEEDDNDENVPQKRQLLSITPSTPAPVRLSDIPVNQVFTTREQYWEWMLSHTQPNDPARVPLSRLKQHQMPDSSLAAWRPGFSVDPMPDGWYTLMDNVKCEGFSEPFCQHLQALCREQAKSKFVDMPAGSKLDRTEWLHLGKYYDQLHRKLLEHWGPALLRKDMEISGYYQQAVQQVEGIISRLEKEWRHDKTPRRFAISTTRKIAERFNKHAAQLITDEKQKKAWLASLQETSKTHPLLIQDTLSASDLQRERDTLLTNLISKNGAISTSPDDLANSVIQYLACDDEKIQDQRLHEVSRLLLQSKGEYGEDKADAIPQARRLAAIAEWINPIIFGMSFETWFAARLSRVREGMPLTVKVLREQIDGKINAVLKNASIQEYYKKKILNNIAPALILPLSLPQQKKLDEMEVNNPDWGTLNAGALMLINSGADLKELRLNAIKEVGTMLELALEQNAVPDLYAQYFRLPALAHHYRTMKLSPSEANTREDANDPTVYKKYFGYASEWYEKHNPINIFNNTAQSWKTRREIALDILKDCNLESSMVNDLLTRPNDAPPFCELKSEKKVFRKIPDPTPQFAQQNMVLTEKYSDVDQFLMADVLEHATEDTLPFIGKAQVKKIRIAFEIPRVITNNQVNAIDKDDTPLVYDAAMANRYKNEIFLDDSAMDILECTVGTEKRRYALEKVLSTGNYKLIRVDDDKNKIFGLIRDVGAQKYISLGTKEIIFHDHSVLKTPQGDISDIVSALAKLHRKHFFEELQSLGYGEYTTDSDIEKFLMDFIPFYTCITEAQKGNKAEAILACTLDVMGVLPLLGTTAKLGSRLATSMAKAVAVAARTIGSRATIQQALKRALPQLTRELPAAANDLTQLGKQIVGIFDPGFELLVAGGSKGIKALNKIITQVERKGEGVRRLADQLSAHVEIKAISLKPQNLYYPGAGPGFGKMLQVVPAGMLNERQLWSQFNAETGILNGRKFVLNAVGHLEPAPVKLNQRLYLLQTEGLGGKGSTKAIAKWSPRELTPGAFNSDNFFKTPATPLLYSDAFLRTAKKYNVIIGLRTPNKLGETLLKEAFPSKNFHLKAKSSATGPTAGFIAEKSKYSKVNPDAWGKQEKYVSESLKKGALSVDLVISENRIKELLESGHMIRAGENRYSARYPGGEEFFEIGSKGEVRDTAGNPVKVLTNPPNTGEPTITNALPVTADYDLFCIIPWSTQEDNLSYLQLAPITKNGKFNLDILKHKDTGLKDKVNMPDGNAQDPDMGNISYFTEVIVKNLNKEAKDEGYKGGQLVWHGDEMGNPFSQGYDPNDKPQFFLPNGEIYQVHSSLELDIFFKKARQFNYAAQFSPVFRVSPVTDGIKPWACMDKIINRLTFPKTGDEVMVTQQGSFYFYKILRGGKNIKCLTMNQNLIPVRKHESGRFLEVYDYNSPEKIGYPVSVNNADDWKFGFGNTKDASNMYMTSELKNKITADMFSYNIQTSDLSYQNSMGMVEDSKNNIFLKIGNNYLPLFESQKNKGMFYYIEGAFHYDIRIGKLKTAPSKEKDFVALAKKPTETINMLQ